MGRWVDEAKRDPYRRKAREEGYRSRAAYKLLEAQKKYELIKRRNIVVELGAWPGGMSQVASRLVGPEGIVVAVDKREFGEFAEKNIITLTLDILEDDVVSEISRAIGGKKADVLISDASPRFTGIRDVDVMRQYELTNKSYEIAGEIVKRGGSVMLKAFDCDELRDLEAELRREYSFVKRFIPKAKRKTSSELYLIAMGKLP
ncbi:MAG: RlmE family RNA methyltransferase [Nitrososphaeria archaeon]|nr:RlmE family RNA methyltransferase [Aigarchaeota archaeon]MCX8187395.1 RlmE family RNA methyltransferase [Nitrososphaeria archaeon]MDW8021804.1 RlmE family RNA methyltransferase [Nitrososphaerota archaeon]